MVLEFFERTTWGGIDGVEKSVGKTVGERGVVAGGCCQIWKTHR